MNEVPRPSDDNSYAAPPPVETDASVDSELTAAEAQFARLAHEAAQLAAVGEAGAKWFYWVAGLSLVNSAIILLEGGMFFVIGMGATLIVDSVAVGLGQEKPEFALVFKAIAFGLDLVAALIVAAFGWLALRRYTPVMTIGMVLYLLDGLIFVGLQDWLSVAFHGFALWNMWSGLQAYRKLNAFEAALRQGGLDE